MDFLAEEIPKEVVDFVKAEGEDLRIDERTIEIEVRRSARRIFPKLRHFFIFPGHPSLLPRVPPCLCHAGIWQDHPFAARTGFEKKFF